MARRWPLRIILCLILLTGGAITTVAVAWGCALARPYEVEEVSGEEPCRRLKGWFPDREIEAENCSGSIEYANGATTRTYGLWGAVSKEAECIAIVAGLPARALSGAQTKVYHYDPLSRETQHFGVFSVQRWLSEQRRMTTNGLLPMIPHWPGFVIDTLFYAAIWFGVFFGFASAKRAIRRKRGRCPRCGYDLRGGAMSDKRLAMSGEEESATLKPQASRLKPSSAPGCPECGWNREAIVQFSIGSGLRRT